MLYKTRIVRSVSQMIEYLKQDIPSDQRHVWYRGHARKDWPLVPALGRYKRGSISMENYLIKRFRQNATLLVPPHSTPFEWLLTMQHHGVPTRLLDWTENPLMALFFTVFEKSKRDGSLWVLLPTLLNQYGNIPLEYLYDLPSFEEPILQIYSTTSLSSEDHSIRNPVAVIVPRTNSRIQAQAGTFTLMHRDPLPIEKIKPGKHVWKYQIPAASKPKILRELRILGINRFSLFPELTSIGQVLKDEI